MTAEAARAGWGPAPVLQDNPLLVGQTAVRSLHITELRGAINALRAHRGMGPYSWQTTAAAGAPVKADPIAEMRAALDEALGAPAGGYSAGLAQGQLIKAIHIQELRDRMLGAWQAGVGPEVRWLVTDQLGTPRMVLDESGSLAGIRRHDYLPFGEELPAGTGGRETTQGYGAADDVRQKFTGYERDIETGLDFAQARYYGNSLGRFISPDPLLSSGRVTDPQSWNRYSYALNNPLRFVDPTGLDPVEYIWGTDGNGNYRSFTEDEWVSYTNRCQDDDCSWANRVPVGTVIGRLRDVQGSPEWAERNRLLEGEVVRLGADGDFEWAYGSSRFPGFNEEFGRYGPAMEKTILVFTAANLAPMVIGIGSGSLAGVGTQSLGLLPGTSAAIYQSSLSSLTTLQLNALTRPQLPLLRKLYLEKGFTGIESTRRALARIRAGGPIPPGLTRETLIAARETAMRAVQNPLKDTNGVQAVRVQIINEALKRLK